MKRVCIYCQTWESGGIESFLNNILQNMDLTDIQIDIVADSLKGSIFTDRLKTLGITFRELSGSSKRLAQNYRRFAQLLDEQNYDVLHLNVFQALPLAYLSLAERKGIPLRIAHSHNTMLRQSRTQWLKLGVHKIARRIFAKDVTELWACSDAAARFMFPATLLREKNYQFIPNGINLYRFQFDVAERENIREQLYLENALVIGNVGRFSSEKNQGFLLDVFAEVLRRRPDSRLLLVGSGKEEAALRQRAEKLGITERVIFYGVSDRVETLLWAMDVFVFPSLFEGLGIAGIEAQAAGLPMVCSDCVPMRARVLDRVHALSLDAGIGRWADVILALAEMPRTGEEAVQVRAAGFDIADVVPQIEKVYREGADYGRP